MQINKESADITDVALISEKIEPRDVQAREKEKTFTMITYGIFGLGLLFGLFPTLAAIVMAYIKRSEYSPPYSLHLSYLISTFWWSMLWFVIGIVTSFYVVGFFILIAAGFWSLYRVIRGFIRLHEELPPHTAG